MDSIILDVLGFLRNTFQKKYKDIASAGTGVFMFKFAHPVRLFSLRISCEGFPSLDGEWIGSAAFTEEQASMGNPGMPSQIFYKKRGVLHDAGQGGFTSKNDFFHVWNNGRLVDTGLICVVCTNNISIAQEFSAEIEFVLYKSIYLKRD
jgi:hypothetical protein